MANNIFKIGIIAILLISQSCVNGDLSLLGKKRVLRTELKKSGGILYYDGKPFTGIGFDMWDEKNLHTEVELKDGKVSGTAKKYFRNGQLEEEIQLLDGEKNGERIEYWENGNKQRVGHYENNKLTGESISYYKNGQVEEKCNYVNGRRDGQLIEYYENGKIKKECQYQEGIAIENCKEYGAE